MDELHLDFETRSEIELDERGLDNYARHPSTQILMMAWAVNDGRVRLWQPHKDGQLPAECREALEDPFVRKFAWNAGFERSILQHRLGVWVPYAEWRDPMVHARHLSLPGYLDDVSKILGLKGDEAKLLQERKGKSKVYEGTRLINLFCSAAVASASSGLFGAMPASFNDWSTHPEDWENFCDYCKQDVVAERAIDKKLNKLSPFPEDEQRLWELDQQINDAGMPVDMDLVRGARLVTEREMTMLRDQLKEITHLENPNSNEQMLAWVQGQGYPFGALGKPFVARAFAGEGELTELGRKALEIRALTSKSSIHKFTAIADNVSSDGRLRGQFVFGGAARTQRWSGRDVQLQNLSRPTREVEGNFARAIELLRVGDYDSIRKEFSSPLDVVTSCTRPAFRAPDGFRFVVADLASIENRVLGAVASCGGIMRVFREGLDPYKDFGTDLFNKPYADVTKEERQKSKAPVLGCGYQLSGGEEVKNDDGDVIKTGLWGYAAAMGIDITREEAHRSVKVFRDKFPEVPELWRNLEDAAIKCVRHRDEHEVGPVRFRMVGSKLLQVVLPSGRPLNYIHPEIEKKEVEGRNGSYTRYVVSYEGVDQKTRQWTRLHTYGGKWTENCLAGDTRVLTQRGWVPIVFVRKADRVWDGAEWVSHGGLIHQGEKEVGLCTGIELTSNHKILAGSEWLPIAKADEEALQRALSSALDSMPPRWSPPSQQSTGAPFCNGTAGTSLSAARPNFSKAGRTAAPSAPPPNAESGEPPQKGTPSSKTPNSGRFGFIDAQESSRGAATQNPPRTPTTAGAESPSMSRGASVPPSSCGSPSPCPTGTRRELTSTASTTMAATSRGICASFRASPTRTIGGLLRTLRLAAKLFLTRTFARSTRHSGQNRPSAITSTMGSQPSRLWRSTTRRAVYDLVNAGPRHRFTIWTDSGPLIVHNCVQAIARDILAHGMTLADQMGFSVVGHVHDELITLLPIDSQLGLKDLEHCMSATLPWAPDLPLAAEGYEDITYRKG